MDDYSSSGAFAGASGGGASIGGDIGGAVGADYGQLDAMANHPTQLIQNGINHLNDPNNGMDFQTRMHLVEPLLRAQQFGQGGGLQNGQGLLYPTPGQSQGQIKSGKGDGSKAAGIGGLIQGVAALL